MSASNQELSSLHTVAYTEEGAPLWLTYKLLSCGGRYGVLCYLEGVDRPHAAAEVADLWGSRAQAEAALRRLASRQVSPAHLEDVLWEM